jgi:Protein of unknown function (DUF4197)
MSVKTLTVVTLVALVLSGGRAEAQLDRVLKDLQLPSGVPGISSAPGSGLDATKVAAGLKEALRVGTEQAVNLTGRTNGYFGNAAIKILMPERLRTLESGLRAVGFGGEVDSFVLSMNRAAERAAPSARAIFVDAITGMSFDDARKILNGPDTAATDYFKRTTTDKLSTAFRPIVEHAMNEVGVTRQYQDLVGQAKAIPFFRAESFDLNTYVVGKGLDGLFHVVGEEEKKIRMDPAARVTELLRDVFSQSHK